MDTYTSPDYTRAALITIDVQRDTLDGQPFEIPGTSSAVPQIARAVQFFRARSQPIVHVVQLYNTDGTNADTCRRLLIERGARLVIAGSTGAELVPALLPSPNIVLDVDRLLTPRTASYSIAQLPNRFPCCIGLMRMCLHSNHPCPCERRIMRRWSFIRWFATNCRGAKAFGG